MYNNHYDRQKETPPGFCTTTRVSRTGPPDRLEPFFRISTTPMFFAYDYFQLLALFDIND